MNLKSQFLFITVMRVGFTMGKLLNLCMMHKFV